MDDNSPERLLQRVQRRMTLFFSEEIYTLNMLEEDLESGDVFHKPSDILPYLQTSLMDEKVLEVEFDGLTRVYFSRVHDHLPDLQEQKDDDGELVMVEPEYNTGDYLKMMTHLITLPLEPGIGNLFIRHSKKIILRLFTTTYAVELGTFFQN